MALFRPIGFDGLEEGSVRHTLRTVPVRLPFLGLNGTLEWKPNTGPGCPERSSFVYEFKETIVLSDRSGRIVSVCPCNGRESSRQGDPEHGRRFEHLWTRQSR